MQLTKVVIAILFFVIGMNTGIPLCRADCEVGNAQQGHWVTRTPGDGLMPNIDRCDPPKGEKFIVVVSSQMHGAPLDEGCPTDAPFVCPVGNDIAGAGTNLQDWCGTMWQNISCEHEDNQYSDGCCKIDFRPMIGGICAEDPVNYLNIALSEYASNVTQWICYDTLNKNNNNGPPPCKIQQ